MAGLLSEDQCKARDARRKARQKLLKVQQQQPTSMDSSQGSPHGSASSADYKDGPSPQTPASDDGKHLCQQYRLQGRTLATNPRL